MCPAENKISVFYKVNLLYPVNDLEDFKPIANAYLAVKEGKIIEVGSGKGYEKYPEANFISLEGKIIVPGFIDAHTHLVYAGSREKEMIRKLAGESYLDILKSGGGILNTVKETREASFGELYSKAEATLDRMLAFGITTVETKSGYGLDFETEIKQLEVVKALNEKHPLTLVSTFMGAHALPDSYKDKREEYLELMKEVLKVVRTRNLASFCDIFCEEGVFSISESKDFLEFAKELGFGVKIHADEMTPLGGAALAVELKATSAEHLLASRDEDLRKLGKSDTIAVLLPLTSFYLDKPFGNARKMIDYGCNVAIASDYNPGSSPSENLQLAMQLAVLKMKMTPKEVLKAVTINAAKAIGLEDTKGSLVPGKDADFVVLDCPNLDYFFYRFGINLVEKVYIKGKKVT
jgi:imidazolonepropionase